MTILTQREKMLKGELYNALDPELMSARKKTRILLKQFNASVGEDFEVTLNVLTKILGKKGNNSWIEPPFYCDYGNNIYLGNNVYFNFNCIILDPAEVHIGNNTIFGPNVQIYTATHPLESAERRKGLELAKPITIGSDVWVGGSAIINPGVKIGSRSIIGSGSVVTRDVPEGVIAVGNPCKVIREVE